MLDAAVVVPSMTALTSVTIEVEVDVGSITTTDVVGSSKVVDVTVVGATEIVVDDSRGELC